MTTYVRPAPDKPWLTLFSSPRLDAIADAIVAQPHVAPSSIYATLDGKPRPLTDAEKVELFRWVIERSPDDRRAAAELAAARHSSGDGAGVQADP